jgi:hypothetical protein
MNNQQDQNTKPFVPYPYDKLPTLNIGNALAKWRDQNRVSESKSMLLVKNGPDKQSLCDCSPVVNQKKRERDNTLVPVIFRTGQDLLQEDVRVYLSDVVVLEDPDFIVFSGKLQGTYTSALQEVHGEYNGTSKRGVLYCFG